MRDAVCRKFDEKMEREEEEERREKKEREGQPEPRRNPAPAVDEAPKGDPARRQPAREPPAPKSASSPGRNTSLSSVPDSPGTNSTSNSTVEALPPMDFPPQGGNPFPDNSAVAQTRSTALPTNNASTVLIVGVACAGMFAAFLIGMFIMHRRRQPPMQSQKAEDGIFDAVPRAKSNTEFKIEDFSSAPTGLYERDALTPPPHQLNNGRPISFGLPRVEPVADEYPIPDGANTPRDLIFSSPFSPTDTGYRVTDEQVFGSHVYGKNYTPNAAAVAAAVVSAVKGRERQSIAWPAEFEDDDPLGGSNSVVDLGYGANISDDVEEFPDVPKVDPNDPRLK